MGHMNSATKLIEQSAATSRTVHVHHSALTEEDRNELTRRARVDRGDHCITAELVHEFWGGSFAAPLWSVHVQRDAR